MTKLCLMASAAIVRRLPRIRGVGRFGTHFTRRFLPSISNSVVQIPMRDGTRMTIDLRSPTEADTLWTGDYDKPLLTLLKRCIRPGDVIADIGANVGLVTVALGAHLSRADVGGRLIAFEPVPTNFQRLTENLKANGLDKCVKAFEFGLGDEAKDVKIVLENKAGASTGNAFVTHGSVDESVGQHFTIRLHRLDDEAHAAGLDRLNLIKVDIEGAEIMFLRGAMSVISSCQPIIVGEFNAYFTRKFGHSILEAARMLKPLGYHPFLISRRGLAPKLEKIRDLEDGMENIAFFPGSRLEIADEFV